MKSLIKLLGFAGLLVNIPIQAHAFMPDNASLIVLNKYDNTASVITLSEGELQQAVIAAGHEPHEAVVSPDGQIAVVSNYSRSVAEVEVKAPYTLSVINIAAPSLEKSIPLAAHQIPHDIRFMGEGPEIVATTEGSQALVIVDVDSGQLKKSIDVKPHDGCHMLALSPDHQMAYTSCRHTDSVIAVDLSSGEVVAEVTTQAEPEGMDITPDGQHLWVADRMADAIHIISTNDMKVVETFKTGKFPIRVKITPDGKKAVVTNMHDQLITVYEVASKKPLAKVTFNPDPEADNPGPSGIILSNDGQYAFITHTSANQVAVLDLSDYKIIETIDVGDHPDGIVYSGGAVQ